MKTKAYFFLAVIFAVIGFAFQNCAPQSFKDMAYVELSSNGDISFVTKEDTLLVGQPKTLSLYTGVASTFTSLSTPAHGTIRSFDPNTAKFEYMPFANYFGKDSFEYSEVQNGTQEVIKKTVQIVVEPENDAPWIETDALNFEMNTTDNAIVLIVKDVEDPAPGAWLDSAGALKTAKTSNGTLTLMASNSFKYTPNPNFRGLDSYEFYAKDNENNFTKKKVILNVGNPFHGLEPALAVRASGCVTCHAVVDSKYITDFGAGSGYFFAGTANPFHSAPGDIYGDHDSKSWYSATIKDTIIVPQVNINRDLKSLVAYHSDTAWKNESIFEAKTLKEYLERIEKKKAKPATVVEKAQVYIGAPSVEVLKQRALIGADATKFIKNSSLSPELSGLDLKTGYYQNAASGLVCDGDLIIQGTVFLKNLTVKTIDGCRLHATDAIFVQGAIKFEKLGTAAVNNTNLQLVSSRWISMGVGLTHCETANNPGWYQQNGTGMSPFEHRIKTYSSYSRNTGYNDANVAAEKTYMEAQIRKIQGLEDASCHSSESGMPRQVAFERLLINAPRVDSRYTGQFNGVIIAEYPLLSLSAFSFKFDTTFNRVPVLPLLKAEDFLVVK